MQALHIECRQPPVPGQPFFPDANAIFNETLIAGPAPPANNDGGRSGLHGSALAIAIALPIVGGILIMGFGCWCCWIVTRRRRRRQNAAGNMDKVRDAHDSAGLYSPVTPQKMWGEGEPPREMTQFATSKQPSPRLNRWSGTPAVVGEDGTPLRSSFQQDHVGPGRDQVQDHDLHEQYFGVADGGPDDIAGPSHHGQAYSSEQRHSGHYSGFVPPSQQPEQGR